jgi:hypothetical protein
MKIIGSIAALVGFFMIIGTAGSDDFYWECRAAADCVAGDPMSPLQFVLQLTGGILLLVWGGFATTVWSK